MQELKMVRKGYFPLRKLEIQINNHSYFIKGNKSIYIDLDEKEYNVIMKMDWWRSNKKIKIEYDTKLILIKFCLADLFFTTGFICICILAVLTFFHKINSIIFPIALLIFTLPQLYFLLFKKEKYFNVKLK